MTEWILMPKELSTEMILGAHHYVSPETWAAFLSARPPLPAAVLDAMVERGARAMVTAWCYAPEGTPDWNANWIGNQNQYRKQARACILAALGDA